ncbi:MAG TPA: AAA family ATPase [Gaiellaceae bacterium]|jgi:non-specific protein-tyrosine kinase|nr:AAA family ATPase [Gaiellaceae bacterium]
MSGVELGRAGRSTRGDEQPIELRRHLDALRRSRSLLITLVVLMTAVALALSLVLPKKYSATATLVYNPTATALSSVGDSTSQQRQLATISSLITTPRVLSAVAPKVGVRERDLERQVTASVDPSANLVRISATASTAQKAAQVANAVASAFLNQQRTQDLQQLAVARAKILQQLSAVKGSGSTVEQQALQSRLSDISVSEASAGQELQLAETARPPASPASPRPLRNAVLAFFAAIFIGVLVALARDQLVPRVGGPRDLTRITDRPVIVGIPFVRGRRGRRPKVLSAAEHEAYQTLQASIRFELPAGDTKIMLITSAVEGEGKTTVTANLGRALARAGRKTLVIGADMRRPRLHELFDGKGSPGLSEILTALEAGGDAVPRALGAARKLLHSQSSVKGNLHLLPAGKKPQDAARLLLSPVLSTFFDELRQMGYDYVLLDGTPLIGLADAQALAQHVDEVLIVSRLDRLRVEDAVDLRDLLERLDVTPLGHAVVGARRGVAYSYTASDFEPA